MKAIVKVYENKTNTTTAYRIGIPKEIADALELKKGDQLELELWGKEVRLKKV
jgi:AbrB family looped-hinge helix DNA binding protein